MVIHFYWVPAAGIEQKYSITIDILCEIWTAKVIVDDLIHQIDKNINGIVLQQSKLSWFQKLCAVQIWNDWKLVISWLV